MRIAVLGPQGDDLFADNVASTLRRMGNTVVTVGIEPHYGRQGRRDIVSRRVRGALDRLSESSPEFRARVQRGWGEAIEHARPQFVLSIDRRVDRSVIDAARRVGAKSALWYPDHVSNMGRHEMFLNGYDRVYLTNPVLVDRLRDVYGLPVSYLPEACNSQWHVSSAPYGTEQLVVMAGTVHATRAALLKRLVQDGFPLRIYGAPIAGWLGASQLERFHTGEYLVKERKADTFRSSRVVLNNLHPGEFGGTNCRLFEATASGALVLTEQRAGLEELFTVGEEVDTFASYDELTTKLNTYLSDDHRGRVIADAAASRSHADHTYESRLARMFEDLLIG